MKKRSKMECNKEIGAGKEEYNTKRMSGELKKCYKEGRRREWNQVKIKK